MRTDSELREYGFRALAKALGPVEAEKFIALIIRESFDYTTWQRTLWPTESVRSLSAAAMGLKKTRSGGTGPRKAR